MNEKNAQFQYRFNSEITMMDNKNKPEHKIWSDKIAQRLIKRKITIENSPQCKYIITRNRTIMDYVAEYVREKDRSNNDITLLNHMRLYKKMILPCELVDLMGNRETNGFRDEIAMSCLKWKIVFPVIPKPSKKQKSCGRISSYG